jgi:tryptophan synthase alpha chain
MTGGEVANALDQEPAGAGRLERLFREADGPLLMPYAVGGYPDPTSCLEILRMYRASGAGLVELGIPFSDPLADGPVIQAASQVALRQGVRPGDVLDLAGQISGEGASVVLLSYLNTILAFDPERFFTACGERGVLGVVVPDLPPEEASKLRELALAQGVDLVFIAAPTSTEARLARIAEAASGFIYCVSTTGVTGARAELNASLPAFVSRLRRHTHLPLAVGFGVSTPAQAASVAVFADGVIVGSALVDVVARSASLSKGLRAVEVLLKEMRTAITAVAAGQATQ